MRTKKTKIVCTLGPSSDERHALEKMLEAGMNVARLNFSHGSYDHMKKIIKNLKEASKNTGRQVALLQDLQGPKIRVGKLPDKGILLKRGQKIILSTEGKAYSEKPLVIPVQYKHLHKDVKKGDRLLMDDGYLEISVEQIQGQRISCKVKIGGLLKSNKGINSPTASISAKTITAKDRKDLEFGLTQGIHYVALSFVKSAEDIEELRDLLKKHGHKEVQIIAKIERHEAIKDLEAIVQATDGIMVARGDMGLEIPAEKVPVVQKEIVRLGLIYGKPVIIATQILESMIHNPRATRAEISDAATAIFDHADAFMLSGETSVGKYPIRAVRTLAKVAYATEKELHKKEHLVQSLRFEDMPITDATCYNAAHLAEDVKAKAIVIITKSGYTARQIMKHRPRIPVIAVTYSDYVKSQLQMVWGMNRVLISDEKIETERLADKMVPKTLRYLNWVKPGDEIVIVNAGRKNNFISTVVV